MSEGRDIAVGMGQCEVTSVPGERLVMNLGSCVGVVIFDSAAGIVGALHAMLPRRSPDREDEPGRYVESGVPFLMDMVLDAGAVRRRLAAKIVGGGNMFPKLKQTFLGTLGDRNVEAARHMLAGMGVKITAEDVGGTAGRTLYAGTDGAVRIRSGLEWKTI